MTDFKKMGVYIDERIRERSPIGHAIAIHQGNVLRYSTSGGWAVLDKRKMTSHVRMGTLSMSKTVTAAGVVNLLLSLPNVTRNSPIHPYLPGDWKLSASAKKITFAMLLTHTSGLRPSSSGGAPDPDADHYANLRASVEAMGGTAQVPAPFFYANVNFCLTRVLIPYLIKGADFEAVRKTQAGLLPNALGREYESYIQRNVLEPCGVTGVSVLPTGEQPYTRFYSSDGKNSSTEGASGDSHLRCGAGYWHMSAREFGKFISGLRSSAVGGGKVWEFMRDTADPSGVNVDARLGMYAVRNRKHGTYFAHNGRLSIAYTAWSAFPDDVNAVVMVNSTNPGSDPRMLLWDAFDNS